MLGWVKSCNRQKKASPMSSLHLVTHPLIDHKMAILRSIDTPSPQFRQTLREISWLLGFAGLAHLETRAVSLTTPLEQMQAKQLIDPAPCLVSILRAGNGLVEGLLDLLPEASVGHLGMARDHDSLEPVAYYTKLPTDIAKRQVILADPMLATGGSAVAAADSLRAAGVVDCVFICLLAAPEGVARFEAAHPAIPIITGALDRQLNEKGYILPGLGDAGDRIYAT